ncbi:hypothetical protein [Jeotgalibacillus proteolyticus]|uniref:Uncharacterized protein n=1 Tax=Jeotgalibacillus proteolyticus TaxID=2082395 RepID=A0A2S5GCX5_9BACL|nr:hypothetical protein [Jeotgalibacillus proteolyticus]PPA70897.1 hypothetical protein C4B60_08915 [Jeotgalibacillus proteolyticus]
MSKDQFDRIVTFAIFSFIIGLIFIFGSTVFGISLARSYTLSYFSSSELIETSYIANFLVTGSFITAFGLVLMVIVLMKPVIKSESDEN